MLPQKAHADDASTRPSVMDKVISHPLIDSLVMKWRRNVPVHHRKNVRIVGGFFLFFTVLFVLVNDDPYSGFLHTGPQARVLVGIFSRDDREGSTQRKKYRKLFEKKYWRDPRICSLPEFQERRDYLRTSDCLFIYTFVVGAHPEDLDDDEVKSELVEGIVEDPDADEDSESAELVVKKVIKPYSKDVNKADVTRLNIRENDHDGKSQTFLYYAYREVMGPSLHYDYPRVEYCMKLSAETFLDIEKFLTFSASELPPAPYHQSIIAGALRDKSYDQIAGEEPPPNEELPRLESFWGNEYEGIHLYMSGEVYIMSYDLVEFTLSELPYSKVRVAEGGYVVGREDHDIFSMAFHSPTPIQIIGLAKSHRFWTYPITSSEEWKEVVFRAKKGY
mmetsp:Transcript_36752/g.105877  ORF Transcript_36752/g.105877 Transcript_36752/m.105877 type:complete len:390 (+) Transcript_36752:3-1172(+)